MEIRLRLGLDLQTRLNYTTVNFPLGSCTKGGHMRLFKSWKESLNNCKGVHANRRRERVGFFTSKSDCSAFFLRHLLLAGVGLDYCTLASELAVLSDLPKEQLFPSMSSSLSAPHY